MIAASAWYSVLSYRKRPAALVLVDHNREWGRVAQLELEQLRVHPAALQFIRSTLGALRKRIERGDVPRKRDLAYLAEKLHGEVRMSIPLPVKDALDPEELERRLVRDYLKNGEVPA